MRKLILIILISVPLSGVCDEPERVHLTDVVTEIPGTVVKTVKKAFSKDAILPWGLITASTLGLYYTDREILNEVQRWGRDNGVGNSDYTKTVVHAGKYPLLRLPSDAGSAFYFLGDGWIHFAIATGFAITGYKGSTRAWNTGLQIIHGMVVATLFSQSIKHATGRESPSQASSYRGTFRPFPSINGYNERTARYDAFPSGHIMTATLMFTVINNNYPEWANYTVPLEVTWLTLLGLQMINNGVHWASDYPLGIGIGYTVAKMSLSMGHKEASTAKPASHSETMIFPGEFDNTKTLNLLATF